LSRVDADDQVVLGDHWLRREADHLLAQIDERPEPVDERHDQIKPGIQSAVVAAESLDDAGPRLGDDANRPDHREQRQAYDQDHEHDRDYGARYVISAPTSSHEFVRSRYRAAAGRTRASRSAS
jgi:hypothetical protein